MRIIAVCFLLLLLIVPASAVAQAEKPDAAVAPLGVIGEIGEGEKNIIFNTLLSLLSSDYQLVSREEYTRAEERAFEELEDEQCTAEQCIRKIQEILQVDRLFVLQVIREQNYTQISLTLARADDKIVKASTCEQCSITQLNKAVEGIYGAILAIDLERASPEQPALEPLEESGRPTWAVYTGGVMMAFALGLYQDATDLQERSVANAAAAQEEDDPDKYNKAKSRQEDAIYYSQLAAVAGIAGATLVAMYLYSGDGAQVASAGWGGPHPHPAPFSLRVERGSVAALFSLRW